MKKIAIILAGVGITMASIIAMAQSPAQGRKSGEYPLTEEERIERRIERMRVQLNLSDEQIKELQELYTTQTEKRIKLQEAHRNTMAKHRENCRKEVSKILNSEQKAIYDSIVCNYGPRYRNYNDNGCYGDRYARPNRCRQGYCDGSGYGRGYRRECGRGYGRRYGRGYGRR